MASLHKPVRASGLSAPGLSLYGTVLTQPDNSQAPARTPSINLTGGPVKIGFVAHALRITQKMSAMTRIVPRMPPIYIGISVRWPDWPFNHQQRSLSGRYRTHMTIKKRAISFTPAPRLPWVKLDKDGLEDNFTPLISLGWQVHVYGVASSELQVVCANRKLPLHLFPCRRAWRVPAYAAMPRITYLIYDPNGYVALAEREGNADAIASYLDARALVLSD